MGHSTCKFMGGWGIMPICVMRREPLCRPTASLVLLQMLHEPDGDVDYLLNGYEFYFMPVMNPDGYQWTFDDVSNYDVIIPQHAHQMLV